VMKNEVMMVVRAINILILLLFLGYRMLKTSEFFGLEALFKDIKKYFLIVTI